MNLYMLGEGRPIWTRRKIAQCLRCGDMDGFTLNACRIHVGRCKECQNTNRDPLPWTELFKGWKQ